MTKISWLSQILKKVCLYPNKALPYKQTIAVLTFTSIFSFSCLAKPVLPVEKYKTTTITKGLNSPWSLVQTPEKVWLITERDGHIVVVKDGKSNKVKLNLPGLYVAGQGGLLDIVLAPDYSDSKQVYLSYAQGQLSSNRLVIVKLKFDGAGFSEPEIIYKVKTEKGTPQHYAGRLLILPDNTLLFSSGDGFDYREQAQVKNSQLGKILRINLDGSIPADNPFKTDLTAPSSAVFSLGHRNPQGLVYDYDSATIVQHEHGPAGGDELNYLEAGNNYGWPVITYGKDYSRARISPFTEYEGMLKPLVNWTPSIAPSGMAYYGTKQSAFPSLNRHVLITTLVDKKLYAVDLEQGAFTQTHVFPEIGGRLRDVIVTDEGQVAVLTDGKDAKVILVSPL